jgi:hypothetical protein
MTELFVPETVGLEKMPNGGGKCDVAAQLKPEGALTLDQMKCKWQNTFEISSLSVFEN